MAFFRNLILLCTHQYLPGFLFGLVAASIMVMLCMQKIFNWRFFFAWALMAYANDAVEESFFQKCGVELPEPEEFDRQRAWPFNSPSMNSPPMNSPPMRNDDRKTKSLHFLQSSAANTFRRQSAPLKKNGGNYAPMVTLEKKRLTLLRTIDQLKKNISTLEEHSGKHIHEEKRAPLLSPVDQYKGKYSHLEEDSGRNVSLLRIEKPELKKERRKNSMYEVKVLKVKQKRKCWLGTTCDIELEGYPRSKRSKIAKDVNGTTSCRRNSEEEKCKGRVEEEPDYMEVEPDYMEVEPDYMEVEPYYMKLELDYMEVEPLKHFDMLIDSVTRIMNNLSLVEQSECNNLYSNMSIDDITTLTMDLNSVEQLNQTNLRMDMSVDDITNLMTGLSLIEHSDHITDMCIQDITNLMKVLSLTSIRRECFCIET